MGAFLQLDLALPDTMTGHTHYDFDWHSINCVLLPLEQPVATIIQDGDTLQTRKQLEDVAVVSAVLLALYAVNAKHDATYMYRECDRIFNVCVCVCFLIYVFE